KLYGSAKNFRVQKVLIAAKLGKTEVELAGEQPPADKFPFGQVPAFDDGERQLFGSDAIASYVGKLNVCPGVTQWLQWAESSLLPNVLGYVLPSVSAAALDGAVVAAYKAELYAQLALLDKYLLSRTYLAGERLSLADISVALDLLPAFQHVLDGAFRKANVNVTRWFQTVVNQPAAKEVLGEIKLAETVAAFNQAEFNKVASKISAPAPKENKKKEEKKKEEPKKKEAKKEEPKEELDLADEAAAAEPKSKDPFEGHPKSSFVLDAFKRSYSNEDTLTKAIPHFWENFDKENWSIWYAEYKFPKELTLGFMSCNLIGGMYQRLEKLKKNAFASVCLFGTDNDSTISGVWVWRGQELVFPLSDDWQIDYESYDWTKLNPDDESTKKTVQEYFMWEGDFGGKKFNQGKIFK
ncbi:hypothetical protein PFISCL1PPCAC_1904, partial [Pristionchus fissidentatus]